MQRLHNITTSKKQLACKHFVMFAVNLCRRFELCVVQKWVDTEISLKLCALLALESCAKVAQHHN